MIISASRRTDIPAFYTEWFMNRIREGYCLVPNPLNTRQISVVTLNSVEVDAIVFWSKNPEPLIPYLSELDDYGFRYYFQFTLNDYPSALEPNIPSLESRLETFRKLSKLIGAKRVIWRYDPIIISNYTPLNYHIERFQYIADELRGFTKRVMVSFVDYYKKTDRRLLKLEREEDYIFQKELSNESSFYIAKSLAHIASNNKFDIFTCAEETDYTKAGICPGMCIDAHLISQLWHINVNDRKDPSQRECCLCRQSKDIGTNNTCLHGCTYCYATSSLDIAQQRFKEHDHQSPMLFGNIDSLLGKPSIYRVPIANENPKQGKLIM